MPTVTTETLPSHGPDAARRFGMLDSLRGLAALIVVLDHCMMVLPSFADAPPPFSWRDPLGLLVFHLPTRLLFDGRASVILFFVLSGFVLSLPWLRGAPPPYPAFAAKRLCRIYIPYIVAVAAAAALATVLAPSRPSGLSQWFTTRNWSEPFTARVALDHLLMLGQHNTFDNVIWSLIHEIRISLVFPLLLLPLLRWRLGGAAFLMVALAGPAWLLPKLIHGSALVGTVTATLQYAVLFVMGAVVARHASGPRAPRLFRQPWWPWLLLATGSLMLQAHWPVAREYLLGTGAALVVLAALAPGRIQSALSAPPLRELGRISYSLYLTHLPLLLSAICLLHALLPLRLILLLVMALALPFAWLFNRWVEEPAIRLGRRIPVHPVRHPVPTARIAGLS